MTKRRDIVRLLESHGFQSRGGTKHEEFRDGKGHVTRVPYHREIHELMAEKIYKQAGLK